MGGAWVSASLSIKHPLDFKKIETKLPLCSAFWNLGFVCYSSSCYSGINQQKEKHVQRSREIEKLLLTRLECLREARWAGET